MIVFLKIVAILVLLLLLFFPLIPLPLKLRRFSTFRALRFDMPHNRLNIFFVILTVIELIVFIIVFRFFKGIVDTVLSWSLIQKLISGASAETSFIVFMAAALIINVFALYVLIIVKSVVKPILAGLFNVSDKKKDKKKSSEKTEKKGAEDKESEEKEDDRKKKKKKSKKEKNAKKKRGIPSFFHSRENDEETGEEGEKPADKESFEEEHPILAKIRNGFWSLFFEGEDFIYMRRWVVRVQSVLQWFIYFVEIAYFLFFPPNRSPSLVKRRGFAILQYESAHQICFFVQFLLRSFFSFPFKVSLFLRVFGQ